MIGDFPNHSARRDSRKGDRREMIVGRLKVATHEFLARPVNPIRARFHSRPTYCIPREPGNQEKVSSGALICVLRGLHDQPYLMRFMVCSRISCRERD